MLEEINEFLDAAKEQDIVEQADAMKIGRAHV